MKKPNLTVVNNPWQELRQFTDARIALGRSGVSLPTSAQLAFQLAHARARDAVHLRLDVKALTNSLRDADPDVHCIVVSSAAGNRDTYLQRPDLGRRLNAASRTMLLELHQSHPPHESYDLSIVIADGLSALAIAQNAQPFLDALMAKLAPDNLSLAPLTIVQQGRVAIGDEVGEIFNAKMVVILIGERPGLSSPDSMGLYLTWAPRVGLTDESRNCISNVRPAGLSYEEAAVKLHYLLTQALRRQLSGILLKDETGAAAGLTPPPERNFLLEKR
ncbi:Ethanolamine ammonia-lyase light chain [Collimonas arenae]|uniref:Ethanolamine ammonia-lyase small subunit n=1 Tax=Collimonas arenae TaxID=279058 RepID=A0A0A1FEY6_9BURK|nr:ethanolamine ammonia-lyase subunit EutC [Collimonas arenae]AIY42229.1 Ethanolamine ammonia-lyase light chain [Collimonas arenae]